MLRVNFSWKVSIICLILAILMVRASFWQWSRHLEKIDQIKILEKRLNQPVADLNQLLGKPTTELFYRQTSVDGEYDFTKEILLKNRKLNKQPGKHVLTPLKISGSEQYVLVNRGFIPLKIDKNFKAYQENKKAKVKALIKEPQLRTFFLQPQEDAVKENNLRKNWLRVDLPEIKKQLKINLITDFYLEKISGINLESSKDLIKSASDKTEILLMPGTNERVQSGEIDISKTYPIPAPDKLLSAGRHLGYVYEWAFMACLTLIIGFLIQLKRNPD